MLDLRIFAEEPELVPSARSNCTTLPKQEYRLAGWLYRSATALCQRCEPLFRWSEPSFRMVDPLDIRLLCLKTVSGENGACNGCYRLADATTTLTSAILPDEWQLNKANAFRADGALTPQPMTWCFQDILHRVIPAHTLMTIDYYLATKIKLVAKNWTLLRK